MTINKYYCKRLNSDQEHLNINIAETAIKLDCITPEGDLCVYIGNYASMMSLNTVHHMRNIWWVKFQSYYLPNGIRGHWYCGLVFYSEDKGKQGTEWTSTLTPEMADQSHPVSRSLHLQRHRNKFPNAIIWINWPYIGNLNGYFPPENKNITTFYY